MAHKEIASKDISKEMLSLDVQVFISSSSFENRCLVIPRYISHLEIQKYYFYNGNETEIISQNEV